MRHIIQLPADVSKVTCSLSRVGLLLLVLFLMTAGWTVKTFEPTPAERPALAVTPVERAAAAAAREEQRAEVEVRGAILVMVRSHRRGASEAWRQRLTDAIYREAVTAEVDPLLVASIVAKESSFKSRIRSHAGAVGLMQLRPFVAKDVARRTGEEWRGLETLHSPEANVRLGIRYYQELIDRFDGCERTALTAYNQGPTRVSRALGAGTYSGSDYADSILRKYAQLTDPRSSI